MAARGHLAIRPDATYPIVRLSLTLTLAVGVMGAYAAGQVVRPHLVAIRVVPNPASPEDNQGRE